MLLQEEETYYFFVKTLKLDTAGIFLLLLTSYLSPMKITTETIHYLATLSKLDIEESEQEPLKKHLENILEFFEQISLLDTENVEPLVYLTDEVNAMREDEVEVLMTKADGLSNAATKDEDYFLVPKMIK